MKNRRAFSTIEMLVACTLLSIVLGVVLQLFTPGVKIWNQSQSIGEAKVTGMLAHVRMGGDLSASAASSVCVVNDTALYAFSCLEPEQPGSFDPATGLPVWRKMIDYYLDGGILYRRTWVTGQNPSTLLYILPTTQVFAFQPDDLRLLCASASGPTQILCQNAQALSLQISAPGSKLWTLALDVVAHTQTGDQTCRQQSSFTFRNGN